MKPVTLRSRLRTRWGTRTRGPGSGVMQKGERVYDEREPWFAVQVRSRYEKNISAALEQKCVEVFLPLYLCSRRWSDRVKQTADPLFPGYTFCRFDPLKRLPVLVTPGVVGIVGIGKTPVPLDAAEVDSVRRIVESGLPADPWPFLAPGQIVRVVEGPLAGLEGTLNEAKRCQRVVVSVTILKRSVAVEVDAFRVQPATLPCPVYTTHAVAEY